MVEGRYPSTQLTTLKVGLLCVVFCAGGWLTTQSDELETVSVADGLRRMLSHDVEGASTSHHKDLFPLDGSDWWGTTLIALGTMIAASGGIGT